MRQYLAYGKLITSANRRRSDGTHLDGRHGRVTMTEVRRTVGCLNAAQKPLSNDTWCWTQQYSKLTNLLFIYYYKHNQNRAEKHQYYLGQWCHHFAESHLQNFI